MTADLKLIQAMLREFNKWFGTSRWTKAEVEAQAAALDGMVLVPREPTEAMLEAAAEVQYAGRGDNTDVYRAMIAAAQKEAKP